jgi:DNA replication initiation complex subunit (GINS family)
MSLKEVAVFCNARGMIQREAGVAVPRLTLAPEEKKIAAQLLAFMMEPDAEVYSNILHPNHGQFDATPGEAARSFVAAFAAKHGIFSRLRS